MNQNNNTKGVFLNPNDVCNFLETYMDWVELEPDQVFCVPGVMGQDTPTGTSVVLSVDGIRCDEGSDMLTISISNGAYSLPVKTTKNPKTDIRLEEVVNIPGTFGWMDPDGHINILTCIEEEYQRDVNALLDGMEESDAKIFKNLNDREIGTRGLQLLERITAEIRENTTLYDAGVTPFQLTAYFIQVVKDHADAKSNLEKLSQTRDELTAKETESEKDRRRQAKELDIVERKENTMKDILTRSGEIISEVILPLLA